MPDGNTTIIIQGKKRFKVNSIIEEKPYMKASIEAVEDKIPQKKDREFNATIDSIKDLALQIINENPILNSSHIIYPILILLIYRGWNLWRHSLKFGFIILENINIGFTILEISLLDILY